MGEIKDILYSCGEYAAAALYENTDRGLFYRKACALRVYYEKCDLPIYQGKPLYPSGAEKQTMTVTPAYLTGINIYSSALYQNNRYAFIKILQDFGAFSSTVPPEHGVGGNMYTHSIPNYIRIAREGLQAYISRIEKIEDAEIREGLLQLVQGIKTYAERCVAYLQTVNADKQLIEGLQTVPMYPAKNIYQAILCWNFVMYLDNCDNIGALEHGLLPYWKGENIEPLLDNLYDNLDANNGYSMAIQIESAGLTCQMLRAAHGKRRPMIELFVDENTPECVWQEAIACLQSGGGQPAFYGKSMLNQILRRFDAVMPEDIRSFSGGGCAESMITGLSCVGSLDAGINLLLILEQTLKESLVASGAFDEFYNCYIRNVRAVVDTVATEISASRKARAVLNPLPMRTLLIDDCIDNGREYNNGGARYNWSVVNFAGMVNVLDSLLAVRTLVYDSKSITAQGLLDKLAQDDDDFLKSVLHLPLAHGRDNPEVNAFAKKLTGDIYTMLDGKPLYQGLGFLPASIQFTSQADGGRNIGATPDGRHAGAPLCDSLAAIFGKDCNGPTALLNSIAAMDIADLPGTAVVNFNLHRRFEPNILKALILGYIKQGGTQMQITCADKDELIDAYHHPERHSNLIVRVGGYSDYFNYLSDELKRMIINRTVQDESWLV